MWNYNLKQGSIWATKSLNNYDKHYEGMQFGETNILILSVYTDVDELQKFTYLKLDKIIKNDFYNYEQINYNNEKFYINFNAIYTGDIRCLSRFMFCLNNVDLNIVLNNIKTHYSFFIKMKGRPTKQVIEKPIVKIKPKQEFNNELTTINKYGLTVKFKQSEDIQLNNNRFKFSKQFKDDIFIIDSNSMCDKYNIYPKQAINIIKSKLKYNQTHT